jgi:16S rRNA (guanine527-N7)-methyltransferase
MDIARIADLLVPYLPAPLEGKQLEAVNGHIELLLRWNAKTNLTAIREPEEMVRRHFGESFFAAAQLIAQETPQMAIDLGSGAGFPGIPLAIYDPSVNIILVESQNKKATFLKEVVRALALKNVTVIAGRGETLRGKTQANLVLMRAVEKFADSATLAATLLQPEGRLALLIGSAQVEEARRLLPGLQWGEPLPIPASGARVLLVGRAKVD